MSEPGTISAATIGNAAEDGSAGTTTGVGFNSGRPTSSIRRPSPSTATRTSAPKWASIRSVWSRDASASITVVIPRALRPASKHSGLDLRRGDGGPIGNRSWISRASEHDRTPASASLRNDFRAHQAQRIENPAHWPLAKRGVAVETGCNPVAADDAHHQTGARPGIAEVERISRLQKRSETRAPDAPPAGRLPLDDSAKRFAGLACSQDVVALEQPLDLRLATGKQAENEGAV